MGDADDAAPNSGSCTSFGDTFVITPTHSQLVRFPRGGESGDAEGVAAWCCLFCAGTSGE
jgi:hypothetical protein